MSSFQTLGFVAVFVGVAGGLLPLAFMWVMGALNTCPHTCMTPTLAPELPPHNYGLLFLDSESMVEVGYPRRQNRQLLLLSVLMCVCVISGRSDCAVLFFYFFLFLFCFVFEGWQNEAIYF